MFSLVVFEEAWADEFDVHGFSVVHTDYVNEIRDLVKDMPTNSREWYFGTNECFEFTFQELFDSFKIVEISRSDAEVIRNIFKGYFGFDMWGHLCESIFEEMSPEYFKEFSDKWI